VQPYRNGLKKAIDLAAISQMRSRSATAAG
jgi:hypothetical protein